MLEKKTIVSKKDTMNERKKNNKKITLTSNKSHSFE